MPLCPKCGWRQAIDIGLAHWVWLSVVWILNHNPPPPPSSHHTPWKFADTLDKWVESKSLCRWLQAPA
ncbi:hypothetical protein ES288_A09G162100v1 [Gossypium darwinii]|uniref:Uncharacterized protein n=1 Tax=Gossypium darwinii TaxID=34276 RepID=A0A5D2F9C9_GOSDA|nr:hypothetical protein ES288_A09G162100v1 [Gossypium darwinii]